MNHSHNLPNHQALIYCQQHNMIPFIQIRNKSVWFNFSVE